MSSPRSIVGGSGPPTGAREGIRVVLREITGTLHNSTPMQTPRKKSINDTSAAAAAATTAAAVVKSSEHEVKVRFAREFADVGPPSYSGPESLSSASSFQSLASNLSSKSSSGICVDSGLDSPYKESNNSYANCDIPGVEDLILACGEIRLNDRTVEFEQRDASLASCQSSQNFSQNNHSFLSAVEEAANLDVAKDLSVESSEFEIGDVSREIETENNLDRTATIFDPAEPSDSEGACLSANSEDNHLDRCGTLPLRASNSTEESPSKDTAPYLSTVAEVLGESKSSSQHYSPIPESKAPDPVLSRVEFIPENKSSELTAPYIVRSSALPVDIRSVEEATRTANVTSFLAENLNPSVTSSIDDSQCPSLPKVSLDSREVNDDTGESKEGTPEVPRSTSPNQSPSGDPASSIADFLSRPESTDHGAPEAPSSVRLEVRESPIRELSNSDEKVTHDRVETVALEPTSQESGTIGGTEILGDPVDAAPNEIEKEREKLPEVSGSPAKSTELPVAAEREDLDATITLHNVSPESAPYAAFQPQQQSTGLDVDDLSNLKESEFHPYPRGQTKVLDIEDPKRDNFDDFDKLELAAQAVSNDIYIASLKLNEESDRVVSSNCEIFQDPAGFDFLLARSANNNPVRDLRAESLYVKFDPLVSNVSMLPQSNVQSAIEERNDKIDAPASNLDTPKRNRAVDAIDRLLFFSPAPAKTLPKPEKSPEATEPANEQVPEAVPVVDENMARELGIVRAMVVQLEEELEKQRKEHREVLEEQKKLYQEKINRLQAQFSQEVKNKNQMTVVVDEYEKSISRLVAESERDRANLELEKAKLQDELQAANHHLNNTEAAFNDVHQKYERLKSVVSAFKSNEAVLKESIQENEETIKAMKKRYDELRDHAMSQLDKANMELDSIRKQNEGETVRLHAMLRKAELKSNSLAEMVEQKAKENKELAQILDEVIARVGHSNVE